MKQIGYVVKGHGQIVISSVRSSVRKASLSPELTTLLLLVRLTAVLLASASPVSARIKRIGVIFISRVIFEIPRY